MRLLLPIFLLSTLTASLPAFAAEEEEGPDWAELTLSGDWGGLRNDLYEKGVAVEFAHKSDVLGNVSGGIENGTRWMGLTEAKIKFDLEKILGWSSTLLYLNYQSALGGKLNTHQSGTYMGVDNIEVGKNTAQFLQAWVQKNLFDDRLSILAGLYPIDSEFYVTDASGVFIHPSYGMAAEAAQAASNGRVEHGPPIFNTSSVGVRVKYTSPEHTMYLMGAVTDAVPGDPNHPYGTQIKLGHGDGTLSIVELGFTPAEAMHTFEIPQPGEATRMDPAMKAHEIYEPFAKLAIGYWHYSSRYDDLLDTDAGGNPQRRHRQGAYALAEKTLLKEADDPDQGLAAFVRLGAASRGVHQSDWSASLGLRYVGLLSGRDSDIAGIAMTTSHASSKYRQANLSERYETAFEATYRAQIRPWLALQPDLQYIINPGMDRTLENTWVVGIRTEVIF